MHEDILQIVFLPFNVNHKCIPVFTNITTSYFSPKLTLANISRNTLYIAGVKSSVLNTNDVSCFVERIGRGVTVTSLASQVDPFIVHCPICWCNRVCWDVGHTNAPHSCRRKKKTWEKQWFVQPIWAYVQSQFSVVKPSALFLKMKYLDVATQNS